MKTKEIDTHPQTAWTIPLWIKKLAYTVSLVALAIWACINPSETVAADNSNSVLASSLPTKKSLTGISFIWEDWKKFDIWKSWDNPVLINFYVNWCNYCKEELPKLMDLLRSNEKLEIAVIIMDYSDYHYIEQKLNDEWYSHDRLTFIFWWKSKSPNWILKQFSNLWFQVWFFPTSYLFLPNWWETRYIPWKIDSNKIQVNINPTLLLSKKEP